MLQDRTYHLLVTTAVAVLAFQSAIVCGAETKPAEIKAAAPKTSPTDVLAKVNGTPITRAELDRVVTTVLAQSHAPKDIPADAAKNG